MNLEINIEWVIVLSLFAATVIATLVGLLFRKTFKSATRILTFFQMLGWNLMMLNAIYILILPVNISWVACEIIVLVIAVAMTAIGAHILDGLYAKAYCLGSLPIVCFSIGIGLLSSTISGSIDPISGLEIGYVILFVGVLFDIIAYIMTRPAPNISAG